MKAPKSWTPEQIQQERERRNSKAKQLSQETYMHQIRNGYCPSCGNKHKSEQVKCLKCRKRGEYNRKEREARDKGIS